MPRAGDGGDKEWTRLKGLGSLMELCGVDVVATVERTQTWHVRTECTAP